MLPRIPIDDSLVPERIDRANPWHLPVGEAIAQLTSSLCTEARLSPVGRLAADVELQRCLDALDRGASVHGSTHDARLPPAVLIGGLPRTGTTALQHMLSTQSNLRSLRCVEALRPTLYREAERSARDLRLLQAEIYEDGKARYDALAVVAPRVVQMHPVTPETIDECTAILQSSLHCLQLSIMFHVPSYTEWLAAQDLRPVYRFYVDQLRNLSGPAGAWTEPLVCKSPLHVLGYSALREEAPNIRIVHIRREVTAWFRSLLNLVLETRRIFSDDVDLRSIAREFIELMPMLCKRAEDMAARLQPAPAVIDLPDLQARPIEMVARVMDRTVGLSPTDTGAVDRMSASMSRAHCYRGHELGAFGLTTADVRRAFRDVTDRSMLTA